MARTQVPNRTAQLGFRLRPHERELVDRAAISERQRTTEWARAALVDAARRTLAREKQ